MKKHPLLILLAFFILLASSCAPFRKVFKTNEASKVEVSASTEGVYEGKETVVDKTITTTVTKESGEKVVPEKKATVKNSIDNLLSGHTLSIDSGWFKMVQVFDSATRTVNTSIERPRDTIKTDVETYTRIESDVLTGRENTAKITTKADSLNTYKGGTVDKKPVNSFWYVVMILGAFAIFLFIRNKTK